jgi:hypothetical protein
MGVQWCPKKEGDMTPDQANNMAIEGQWFRIWMPYCFVKLESPAKKHVYLPLNRNYKPLGMLSRKHLDYETFRAQAVQFKTDPKIFKGIWHLVETNKSDDEQLWLYEDVHTSRIDYFARLEKLVLKTMKLVGQWEKED